MARASSASTSSSRDDPSGGMGGLAIVGLLGLGGLGYLNHELWQSGQHLLLASLDLGLLGLGGGSRHLGLGQVRRRQKPSIPGRGAGRRQAQVLGVLQRTPASAHLRGR